MSHGGEFRHILEPFQVNQVRFRSRLVKLPQDTAFANEDGSISPRVLHHYDTLARGGVGAIIVEHAAADSPLGRQNRMISIADDRMIPGLSSLVETVHRHGCPIIQQINHLGPMHHSGVQAVSSSALSEAYMRQTFGGATYDLRALTVAEIEDLVEKFARAVERARDAGFDGVEIHSHRLYLLNSFLSPLWNKREDEYGCQNLDNRTRFIAAIFRASRARVGGDYLMGVRIKGPGFSEQENIPAEEGQQIAKILEGVGADYINVVVGSPSAAYSPEPPTPMERKLLERVPETNAPLGAAIKTAVSIPVIMGGLLDLSLGERLVRDGMADGVAFGRLLFADPELPRKIAEGRLDDIVPCTGCNTCLDRYVRGLSVACQVNAALAGGIDAEIQFAEKRKRIVVVGGGPAGMEAARVAALRGHEVTLFERERKLGGALMLAASVLDTRIIRFPDLLAYLGRQMDKLGVKVRLGEEFTAAKARELEPDALILAVGAVIEGLDIPGIDGANVLTRERLERRARFLRNLLGPVAIHSLSKLWLPIGKRVVIIGGMMHGCEIAEFLIKRGRKVTIVESRDQLGIGIIELYRGNHLRWLEQNGSGIHAGVRYKAITEKGLLIVDKDGGERTIEADTVLVAVPPKPNKRMLEMFRNIVPEAHLVGDGKEPGVTMDAIAAGFEVGRIV